MIKSLILPSSDNKKEEIIEVLNSSCLESYKESLNNYNEKAKEALNKFNSHNEELIGSSPLMIIHLLNSGLLPPNSRIARREDIELSLSLDKRFLNHNYVDFGLAIRDIKDGIAQNKQIAERLIHQLTRQGIDNLKKGKLIPLDQLVLKEEESSPYGLVLNLKCDAAKSIKDLNIFEWTYSKPFRLSTAGLMRRGGWFSDDSNLANSGESGRVIIVRYNQKVNSF